ncbi:MAG TPA: hypothetical protein VMZ71_02290 [Gemmataceae bacterium]|nr:hypothetical protein [Gemmataceae bacterium]
MAKGDDDALGDSGLEWEHVSMTAQVVYQRISGADADDLDGWAAVARTAGAMFGFDDGADEGEVSIPLVQMASQLRRAYTRGAGTDGDVVEWKDLAPQFRLAWEGVTRHLSNVFGFDRDAAKHLGQHEDRIVHFMTRREPLVAN